MSMMARCGVLLFVAAGFILSVCGDPFHFGPDENGFVRYPEFVEPPAFYATDGHLEITLEVDVGRVPAGPWLFNARMYNKTIPGPTMYLKPGDHLTINLINNLGPQNYSDFFTNSLHNYNSTNMHTHGLHVPSASDNVFVSVDPSQTFTYEYDIVDDHYPGTMFYHPHHHGASAIQMYTMHGALIVLPPHSEFLDPFLRQIEFKVMVLQHMYAEASSLGAESIWDLEDLGYSEVNYDLVDHSDVYNISDSLHNVMINGQYQPVMTVNKGEWFGLRFIHTGAQYLFMISFHGCQAILIARDGVYLAEALVEDVIYMIPGNRADVVVRCEENGIFEVNSVYTTAAEWMCDPEGWVHCFTEDVLLFLINVVGEGVDSEDFPANWSPPTKPWYLQDLSDIPQSELNGTFEFVGGFDNFNSPAFNEHAFVNETDYVYGFSMHPHGIYEINITMDNFYTATHPVHIHVNHFQIVGEYVRDYDADYTGQDSGNITSLYRIGEHRDTVLLFPNRVMVTRFSTFGFTGTVTFHCHYNIHADLGMVSTIAVSDGFWDQGQQNKAEEVVEMETEQDLDMGGEGDNY